MRIYWIPLKNKFSNKLCLICGEMIPKGEDIEWLKGNGIRHTVCGQIYDEIKQLEEKALQFYVSGRLEEGRKFHLQSMALMKNLNINHFKSKLISKPSISEISELEFLSIPEHEDLHNEFKSSFQYDYEVDRLIEQGNIEGADARKDRKNNYENILQKEIATSVCAFLNNDGGNIWIGIDNNRSLLGLEKDFASLGIKPGQQKEDVFRQKVSGCLTKYLKTEYPKEIKFDFEKIGDKDIFHIEVQPLSSAERPAYVHDGEKSKVPYVRQDEHDLPYFDFEEWMRYVKKRFPGWHQIS